MRDLESKIYTSWTEEQLSKLIIPSNHRITFDGYEYWWYHRIDGRKWELHFIKGTQEPKKLISYLRFWIHLWKGEYNTRVVDSIRKGMKELDMNLEISQTYLSISSLQHLTIQEKIELMNSKHKISFVDEVASMLKVSPTYVRSHLKKLSLIG